MVRTAHLILTYRCPLRCNHCFVYSSPKARGKFTHQDLNDGLNQLAQIEQIDSVIFDGGEPFLEFPTLLFGARKARQLGLQISVMTNGFFARNRTTGINYLRPLAEIGIEELFVSIDGYHFQDPDRSASERALEIATELGINGKRVSVSPTTVQDAADSSQNHKDNISERPLRYFGRAVDLIPEDKCLAPAEFFTTCPVHNFASPTEIYLDPEGLVSLCLGIAIGNFKTTPLKSILENYPQEDNPIVQCLMRGGPAELASGFNFTHLNNYADACHACFTIRKALLEEYPAILAPRQVYGLP